MMEPRPSTWGGGWGTLSLGSTGAELGTHLGTVESDWIGSKALAGAQAKGTGGLGQGHRPGTPTSG